MWFGNTESGYSESAGQWCCFLMQSTKCSLRQYVESKLAMFRRKLSEPTGNLFQQAGRIFESRETQFAYIYDILFHRFVGCFSSGYLALICHMVRVNTSFQDPPSVIYIHTFSRIEADTHIDRILGLDLASRTSHLSYTAHFFMAWNIMCSVAIH